MLRFFVCGFKDLFFQRQTQIKFRSLADFAFYADASMHFFYQTADNRQPQTRAFSIVIRRIKRLKYMLKLVFADTDSRIANREADVFIFRVGALKQLTAVRHGFYGVLRQVQYNHFEVRLIAG